MKSNVEIDMVLDEWCPVCGGSGNTWDKYADPIVCPKCSGNGYALTDEGVKVLDFINRRYGLTPVKKPEVKK